MTVIGAPRPILLVTARGLLLRSDREILLRRYLSTVRVAGPLRCAHSPHQMSAQKSYRLNLGSELLTQIGRVLLYSNPDYAPVFLASSKHWRALPR